METGAVPAVRPESVDEILALQEEQARLGAELPLKRKEESLQGYQARLKESPAYVRQTEILKQITELRSPALRLCEEADVGPAARVLAERVDLALADNVRAAKAVLALTKRMHPGLAGMPVVTIGFSAGALSTPTVAAAINPDAVVIVGGASNAIGVAMTSRLSRGGVRVACGEKGADLRIVERLCEEYLRVSKLDAYHTAPMLRGIPVLVVDAGKDTWVTSRYGQELYERLGKPDRLHMALGGHGMLFYFLPRRAEWIVKWVERVTGRPLATPGSGNSLKTERKARENVDARDRGSRLSAGGR